MVKLALLGWGKESPIIYQTIQEQLKGVQLIGVSSGDEEVLQKLRSSSEIKSVCAAQGGWTYPADYIERQSFWSGWEDA